MTSPIEHTQSHQDRQLARIREIVQEELQARIAASKKSRTKRFRLLKLIFFRAPSSGGTLRKPEGQGRPDALLLVIASHRALADMSAFWEEVEDRFRHDTDIRQNLICLVHTAQEVNQKLRNGSALLSEISRHGIVLSGDDALESRFATPEKDRQISLFDSKEAIKSGINQRSKWSKLSRLHLRTASDRIAANEQVTLNFAAFQLHQAAESAYRMFFLTVTSYAPATHQLGRLRHLARSIDQRLEEAWRPDQGSHRHYFDLLCRAYIEARYSQHYETSEAALRWQADRIEKLINIADALCLEHLDRLRPEASREANCKLAQTLV